MPALTEHAVQRYATRIRPELSPEDARAELEHLAREAVPTRRRTLNGDAQVYVARRHDGDNVSMVVRDDVVVTVLAPGSYENVELDSVDPSLLDESAETIAACRAMIAQDESKPQVDRERSARQLLDRWAAGTDYTIRALRRAHETLGLFYDGRKRP